MKPLKPVHLIFLRPPFKYTSSWLIFLHVMKWNHIRAFHEIRELLEVDGCEPEEFGRWWDGVQVPHSGLEDACGLMRNELKYSFLDGWFPLPEDSECETLAMRPRPRIRHCPKCIKLGYHSVIFYFEHITHCPWHNEALEYCQQCSDVLSKKWRGKKGIAAAAEKCEHLGVILDVLSAEVPLEDFHVEVVVWCNELKDWSERGSRLIGQDMYEVVVAEPSKLQDKEVVFKFLADRASPGQFSTNVDAPVSMLKIPLSKLAWEKPFYHILSSPSGECITWYESLRGAQPRADIEASVSTIKSIRRYIFRRYIRYHRKCLARLVRTASENWYAFNLNTVCPCVMAYLIVISRRWDVSPWDLLHIKTSHLDSYATCCAWRGETLQCECELGMYKLIGNFYKMWSILRHFREINCRTLVLSYRHDGSLLGFVAPMIYETARRYRDYIYWDAILFMEDPEIVLARSIPDCAIRRRYPLNVWLGRYPYWVLSNNKNILCALHNLGANNNRRLDL
ncbi:hypothetical protein SB725_09115 [Pseudomonas sp. SIMBA_041]|uniref:hypothetical protein n=1 Tax=Pseudomonas sp. SIMBA_041 TaxID=3085782 RepID=UPI00397E3098